MATIDPGDPGVYFMKELKKRIDAGEEKPWWGAFFAIMQDGLLDNQEVFGHFFSTAYVEEVPNQDDFRQLICPRLDPKFASDEEVLDLKKVKFLLDGPESGVTSISILQSYEGTYPVLKNWPFVPSVA